MESRPERYELNLYVSGEDEDADATPVGATAGTASAGNGGGNGSTEGGDDPVASAPEGSTT